MAALRGVYCGCLLLALLFPLQVLSQGLDLADALGDDFLKTTTAKPAATKAPNKPKPKPEEFSDSDLIDVSKDDNYKPDKGKGGRPGDRPGDRPGGRPGDRDHINQYEDNNETTAEVGTIAGIASAVVMALVGAVTSYISYQKKKLCFGIQQSLNAGMIKADNPDCVVASEPQVQQTLLQQASAEPRMEENVV
ncbi:CD99 antigen-like protein 2 isoform X3 [Nerophis lumbriciformis]|uniref:CD99 antigen-like protein 2 isoform X3 n=1 Tax=Nerophis lumbriciformis TaxID=546530 RepID=UPI002ADFBBD1|nr:CD99 antigen-like protein 2 isoform X3 [Nerophis lumbriciformis]